MGKLLGSGCGLGVVAMVVLNVLFGGFATQFVLYGLFGASVALLPCILAGFFIGQFTIPIAIVLWLLQLGGLSLPLF